MKNKQEKQTNNQTKWFTNLNRLGKEKKKRKQRKKIITKLIKIIMETIKVIIITKPMETGIIANQDKVEKTQQIIAVLKNISKSENNNRW